MYIYNLSWLLYRPISFYIPTRPVVLAVMCEYWTPKGDSKVTGNKERNQLQFYEENPFQNEQTQKIENCEFAFNFT